MNVKQLVRMIAISVLLMLGLLAWVYKFDLRLLYISNVMFVVGIGMFFIGIVMLIGAGEVFDGSRYVTQKMFARDGGKAFKTFSDYKVYQQQKGVEKKSKSNGMNLLGLGAVYAGVAFLMGFVS